MKNVSIFFRYKRINGEREKKRTEQKMNKFKKKEKSNFVHVIVKLIEIISVSYFSLCLKHKNSSNT